MEIPPVSQKTAGKQAEREKEKEGRKRREGMRGILRNHPRGIAGIGAALSQSAAR